MKFAIIGLGHFGKHLATELVQEKHQVVAVDINEQIVDDIKESVDYAVAANATDIRSLEELSLDEMDVVVVAIGEDWANALIVTGHLQEIGVARIICRAVNPIHHRILKLMKVDEIVQVEEMAATQLAKRLKIIGAARHFALSDHFSIVELKVPESLVGKTIAEANLNGRHKLNLITVKRVSRSEEEDEKGELLVGEGSNSKVSLLGVLSADECFKENDSLIVFGNDSDIEKIAGK